MAILFPITPPPLSPKICSATVATVAAGGQAVLNSDQITTGHTAKLLCVIVTSSVPFKAEVYPIAQDVPGSRVAIWYEMERGWEWRPPSTNFVTAFGTSGGYDGFRVLATNLDTSDAADIHAVFYYDEG